jgi:hypothetical protein
MGSVGHVASVGEMRNNFVLKPEQKKPVEGGDTGVDGRKI